MKRVLIAAIVLSACLVLLTSQYHFNPTFAQDLNQERASTTSRDVPRELAGSPVTPTAKAIVNMADLARRQAESPPDLTPGVMVPPNPIVNEEVLNQPNDVSPERSVPTSSDSPATNRPSVPQVASPSPVTTYLGHNDVPKVGTGTIVIPPDTTGAVGLTKVVTSLNNNYVIQDKTTGAVLSSVSMDTFWAGTGATGTFDPRILYDPYNDRWIVSGVSNAQSATSSILIGVSTSSDPSSTYFLSRFDADATDLTWADFPLVGFNKDWVSVNVNMFVTSSGASVANKNLILDYLMLRAGTFSAVLFSGSGFCSSPAITYSTTEATLYLPTLLNSGGATYRVDTITGAPPTPVYTVGATMTRTGGGWVQPAGNILPQAAPLSGASACGATPCRLETQDAQIRSNAVFRGGFIYYAQTVGLPSGGLTHTAVQWTKLTASTGAFADGGRVEDATATSTNGGKWYAYPSIAVNSSNDVMFGFSQFSSSQFPSAGYTYRFHSDAPGLMRDPFIYKAGEDYYHKTLTFTSGRNRWGDYSTTQVDPSNDRDLWTIQEYTQARVGTDDGNTGTNSSRWSTWWAKVAFDPTAAAVAIGGRIQSSGGRFISRAVVTLTYGNGQVRTAISNQFGRYQFDDVPAGETYLLSVTAKGYEFTPQVVTATQAVTTLDFTAQ